jgi:hypothetical protein
MATVKQASSRRLKMAERAQALLAIHFPTVAPEWLWNRKTNDGYTTVPRTMPLVMQVIDAQTKGQPAGHTLFCLWARSPDHPLLTIENPAIFASEAGFFGERAVDTWRRRMKQLQALGFIMPKAGPSGDFHYVLLLNPNASVECLRTHGKVQDVLYSRFIERLADVGGYGEIEAIRSLWERVRIYEAQVKAAATSANATAGAVEVSATIGQPGEMAPDAGESADAALGL